MGLFTKKPTILSSGAPLYTVGGQQTLLIAGLGNPGKKYHSTRHNIGFACVDELAARHPEFSGWISKKDLKCEFTSGVFGNSRVIVIKPATYMNSSGQTVQAVAKFYKIEPKNIVVVYDELDLPFGQIRMRSGGGSAGHNGIKSIIEHLGDGFSRVRIGIANQKSPMSDSADFVLKPFNVSEKKHMNSLVTEVDSILTEYIYRGDLVGDTRSFII